MKNTPIISKTVGIWKRNNINWSGGYMIYIVIDIAKKKFDYCIIDKLRIIKREIIINMIAGMKLQMFIKKLLINI